MGKSKKTVDVDKRKLIPYLRCYEGAGMIEIREGVFSRTYKILPPEKVIGGYSESLSRMYFERILLRLAESFSFEFTFRNCFVEKDAYLAQVELHGEGGEQNAYDHLRDLYNKVIRDNFDIGHNNFIREVYLTITAQADSPDEAVELFEVSDDWIVEIFHEMYGLRAVALDLVERLKLLYEIYHPGQDVPPFGSKVDFDGQGFSFASMRRMKMDTKDVIAQDDFDCPDVDCLKLGQCYARSFFISTIPESVPDSMLLDLTAVSAQAIVSIHYESVDQELGFYAAAKEVEKNTDVKLVPVRDTVADRRANRMNRLEQRISESEDDYFYQTALQVMKQAKAKNQPAIQAAFVITLFAESMDELDRDSSLLKLSAAKYVLQLRCLDLQQKEGFASVLPLGNLMVKAKRLFSIAELAAMQPLTVQEFFDKHRTCYGLNAINDNLIFLDRSVMANGVIVGAKQSGKTFAVKREALNALLSSDDEVVILSEHPGEYADFVRRVDSLILADGFSPDLLSVDVNYNLNSDKAVLLRVFWAAYLMAKEGIREKKYDADVMHRFAEQVEHEAEILSCLDSWNDVLVLAKEQAIDLQLISRSLEQLVFCSDSLHGSKRLSVIGFGTEHELLADLHYLWNYAVAAKKKNHTVWIMVDCADCLLYSTWSSDYLFCLLERAELLHVPVSLVIGDSVHVITNKQAVVEFEHLFELMRFYKLLSMGPVERRKICEVLNISKQLFPYLSERGAGEGVLVTPAATVAFTDRFEADDNEFYGLFK